MSIKYIQYKECENISDVPSDAIIEEVDGIPCVGRCHKCGKPVLLDQVTNLIDGIVHNEGVYSCIRCDNAEAYKGEKLVSEVPRLW